MPTYEYECQKCGHTFEKFQSMTEKPIRKCPACKKMSVKRLIGSGAGIIFKGSGFYATDYRKAQPRSEASKTCPVAKKDNPKCSGCDAANS